jgi:hypothetical protein
MNPKHRGKFIDLTGKEFNRWTVLEFSHFEKHFSYWKCICSCENKTIKNIRGSSLEDNGSKSCGCLIIETVIKNHPKIRKGKGEAGFNKLYRSYRNKAIGRGIYFDDSLDFKEYFKKNTKENCYNCGKIPKQIQSNVSQTYSEEGREHAQYIYNGIDRIDSDKGYEFGNIVACCGQCNCSKSDYEQKEFDDWIINVYNHKKSTGQIKI